MSDWQPIETAPKDREILLWFPWDLPPGNPQGAMYVGRWLFSDDGRDRWIDPVDANDLGETCSHWMPLPTPPIPSKEL